MALEGSLRDPLLCFRTLPVPRHTLDASFQAPPVTLTTLLSSLLRRVPSQMQQDSEACARKALIEAVRQFGG